MFNNPRGFSGQGHVTIRGRSRFNNNRGYFKSDENRSTHNSDPNHNAPQIPETTERAHIAYTTNFEQVGFFCGYPNHYAKGYDQKRPATRNQQTIYRTLRKCMKPRMYGQQPQETKNEQKKNCLKTSWKRYQRLCSNEVHEQPT